MVTGSGSSIVKAGLGTLQLSNNNTFNGGVTLNSGTLLATGPGGAAGSAALGTGTSPSTAASCRCTATARPATRTINYGNNVLINGTLANAFIDINNNGANTGNTIVMGQLGLHRLHRRQSGPDNDPERHRRQQLQAPVHQHDPDRRDHLADVQRRLGPQPDPAGRVHRRRRISPTNIGAGTLLYSGSNIGAVGHLADHRHRAVAPPIAQTTTPLGTGAITLNSGATLQISPIYSSAANTTGYTAGGFTAKYYSTGTTTMANAANFGVAPGGHAGRRAAQ